MRNLTHFSYSFSFALILSLENNSYIVYFIFPHKIKCHFLCSIFTSIINNYYLFKISIQFKIPNADFSSEWNSHKMMHGSWELYWMCKLITRRVRKYLIWKWLILSWTLLKITTHERCKTIISSIFTSHNHLARLQCMSFTISYDLNG